MANLRWAACAGGAIAAVIAASACSSKASQDTPTFSPTPSAAVGTPVATDSAVNGWLGSDQSEVWFVQLTEANGQLHGQWSEVQLLPSLLMQPKVTDFSFDAVRQGTSIVFGSPLSNVRGELASTNLVLNYTRPDGTISKLVLTPGNASGYNAAVRRVQADRDRQAGNIADSISSRASAETKAACQTGGLGSPGTKVTIRFEGPNAVRDCEAFLIEGGAKQYGGSNRGLPADAAETCSGTYGQSHVTVLDSAPAFVGGQACDMLGLSHQ